MAQSNQRLEKGSTFTFIIGIVQIPSQLTSTSAVVELTEVLLLDDVEFVTVLLVYSVKFVDVVEFEDVVVVGVVESVAVVLLGVVEF